MNENNNRVQAAMAEEEFRKVLDLLREADSVLAKHMVGLTADERMGLPKINVDNRDYVTDAIIQMRMPDARNILPAFLKPEDAESDIKMFDQMEEVSSLLLAIHGKVDATRIIAGSESYTSSLLFKKLAEAGEAAGIPGAAKIAERLRERFKANGSSSKTQDDKSKETTDPA